MGEQRVVFGDEVEAGRFERLEPRAVLDGRRRFEVRDVQTGEPVSWEVFADAAFGSGPGAVVVTGSAIGDRASVALMRRALSTIGRRAAAAVSETTGDEDLAALEAIAATVAEALDQGAAPGDVAELLGQDDDAMLDALLDQRVGMFESVDVDDAGAFERRLAELARTIAGPMVTPGAAFDSLAYAAALYRERMRSRLRKRLGGAEPPR